MTARGGDPTEWLRQAPDGFLPSQWLARAMQGGLVHLPDEPLESEVEENLREAATRGQGASIELRLGREYYVTNLDVPAYLSDGDDMLVIPGGQFALLTTYETIDMPTRCFALISMKSTTKLKGLVNISGFHVDPGWKGRIHYAVFNAGPTSIALRYRQRLFQMFVCKLPEAASMPYPDKRPVQDELSQDLVALLQGRPVTLDSLSHDVTSLKAQFRVFLAVVIPTTLLLLGEILRLSNGQL